MLKYLIIFGLIILAWCPWLKKEEALEIVNAQVLRMQKENKNLCKMSIDKNSITKVPFGYTEKVSYDCAATDELYGVLKSSNTVFITFYKKTIGMPNKTVDKNFRLLE